MTLFDIDPFNTALSGLHAIYPMAVALDEDKIQVYWKALMDLPLARVEQACTLAATEAGVGRCKFFPMPGVLRMLAQQAKAEEGAHRVVVSDCPLCDGTGCVTIDPDMAILTRVYGLEVTADTAQRTVRQCQCRQ